ncbi:hypothetical protein NECAME_12189 [Necator americanus]|uniref:Uncharacterized protein n=1 Tax=Necator americanus TaxID=51031 RepID=W2T291_NECAM|nr:hypothetical protein NECAME_12189 [Necator americanus]ETN75689.1 hypothetical protein NECAME_12189 [Necator americanus]
MQRTKRKLEAKERKKREAEAKKQCLGEDEDVAPSEASKSCEYQYSTDLTFLEGLKFGRMSFKGCNPEVEKLMAYYERKMMGYESDSESDDGKDVGDVEMATTLRGPGTSIARKFYEPKKLSRLTRSTDSLNEVSSNERLNFSDFRKRTAGDAWTANIDSPPKKSRKSS